MNLEHRNKFTIAQAKDLPRLSMDVVEFFQHNRLIMRQLDSRNAPDESVTTIDTL